MIGIKLGLIFGGGVTLLQQAIAAIRRNNGTLIGLPDDFAGAYTDSAGTTPVTALADVMGLVLDGVGVSSPVVFTAITAWLQGGAFGNFSGANASGDTITALAANGARYIRFPVMPGQFVQYSATVTAGTSAGAIVLSWGTSAHAYISATASADTSSGVVRLSGIAPANAAYVEFCIRAATSGGTTTFTGISASITAGNHATQSTTASKPTATRIPKRLGPEMIASQDLTTWTSGGAFGNWAGTTSTATTITTTGTNGGRYVRLPCTPGKTYTFAALVTAGTVQGAVAIAYGTSGNVLISEQTGLFTGAGVARSTTVAPANAAFVEFVLRGGTSGQTVSFASITAGEVLEWTNAISFDGSNDFLQTGITTGNEGWVCAGVTFSAPLANNETVFSNGAGSSTLKGVWLIRLASGSGSESVRMGVGNGTSLAQVQAPSGMNILGAARVVEGGWTASTVEVGVDGQTASAARTGDATPAPYTTLVGAYVSGFHHLGGPMTATVYCPVLPSAADRALIRSFVGALQGQSL